MASILVPPIPKTTYDPGMKLYTIRKEKTPMAWNINDRSTMLSFKNVDHAILIASMAESHYKSNKEWPIEPKFEFHRQIYPTILGIKQYEYEKISSMCSLWGVNLLILDDIEEVSPLKYQFVGEIEKFDEILEEHKEFLDFLYIN